MKFLVAFTFTQTSSGSLYLEAESPAEAAELAAQVHASEVEEWHPVKDQMAVETVEIADQ